MAQEIKLKRKYTAEKPKGTNRADYTGNSGKGQGKHTDHPHIHGIRKRRMIKRR